MGDRVVLAEWALATRLLGNNLGVFLPHKRASRLNLSVSLLHLQPLGIHSAKPLDRLPLPGKHTKVLNRLFNNFYWPHFALHWLFKGIIVTIHPVRCVHFFNPISISLAVTERPTPILHLSRSPHRANCPIPRLRSAPRLLRWKVEEKEGVIIARRSVWRCSPLITASPHWWQQVDRAMRELEHPRDFMAT